MDRVTRTRGVQERESEQGLSRVIIKHTDPAYSAAVVWRIPSCMPNNQHTLKHACLLLVDVIDLPLKSPAFVELQYCIHAGRGIMAIQRRAKPSATAAAPTKPASSVARRLPRAQREEAPADRLQGAPTTGCLRADVLPRCLRPPTLAATSVVDSDGCSACSGTFHRKAVRTVTA